MHSPQIVGSRYQMRSKNLDQKPSIYKTILKGHQTSVTRPTPKLTQVAIPNNSIHVMTALDLRNHIPVRVIKNYSTIPIKVEKRIKPLSVQEIKMENNIHSLEQIIFIKSREGIVKIK